MPYTTEDGGRLNNFAREPKVYTEASPSATEKRNYILGGVAAVILVSGLMFVAFSVSSMG